MKKLLNNPVVVLPLAVFAVVVVGWVTLRPMLSKSARKLGGKVADAAQTAVATVLDDAVQQVRTPSGPARPADRQFARSRFTQWVEAPARDPFGRYPAEEAKIAVPEKPPIPLVLSAIWRQSGRQMAVINGQVVSEGDEAFDFKIERVENNVVLVRGVNGLERLEFPRVGSPAASTNTPPVTAAQIGRAG